MLRKLFESKFWFALTNEPELLPKVIKIDTGSLTKICVIVSVIDLGFGKGGSSY